MNLNFYMKFKLTLYYKNLRTYKITMKKTLIILYTLLFINNIIFSQKLNNDSFSTTDKIEELFYLIKKMYVEPVDEKLLLNNFLIGMSNGLTPHTLYANNVILEKNGFHKFDFKNQKNIQHKHGI